MDFEWQEEQSMAPYLGVPGFDDDRERQRVCLAFTTRLGGVSTGPYAGLNLGLNRGDDDAAVLENRRLLCRSLNLHDEQFSFPRQVHGDRVLVIADTGRKASPAIEADAQVTDVPGIALFGLFADCMAVYLYDPVRRVIGLAHAGWRGTVAGIARKTLTVMTEHYGTRPEHCRAALSPAAGPCCYEVGDDVAAAARSVFPPEWNILKPLPEEGKWTFDLREGNARWLQDAGLKRENIVISQLCTMCRQDLFFSYRSTGGVTGRMAAVIWMS